jgi:uncharacterized protein (AIM24 family)
VTLQQQIVGNAMQMAVCTLQPGQTVYCEAGKFLFKTSNVTMETRLGGAPRGGGAGQQGAGGAGGGMGGFLRQAMGTAMQVGQRALAGESLAFQYFTATGGEGFILEKFTGRGTVIIAGAGNFIDINPAEFGGRIEVDTGCIVAFEEGIHYGVQRIGGLNRQGIMNAVFGGEGLSLATLEGNGQVILQSMTIEGLSNALHKHQGGDKQGPTGGLFSSGMG